MDGPLLTYPSLGTIHPYSSESIGAGLIATGGTVFNSVASTVLGVDVLIYIPFSIGDRILVKQLFCYNGATVNGNVDVGIYSAIGKLIISAGSTAQTGASVLQLFDIADTPLDPGDYYLCIGTNSATATFFAGTTVALTGKALGLLQDTSIIPLPTESVFTTYALTMVPIVGLTIRTVV